MYIQTTDPHDSQWWDMYLDEREFWDEFPSVVEALLRRRSVFQSIDELRADKYKARVGLGPR